MTHFLGLVIGPDIEGQLARYDENLEVEEHRSYEAPPSQSPTGAWNWPYSAALSLEPDLDVHDLAAVAKVMTDGRDARWDVDDVGLYTMSTYNPDSKWDWWHIGGRWPNWLILRDGGTADCALGDELDWNRTVLERAVVPGVLVAEGVWREQVSVGWFGTTYNEQMSEADWGTFVTRMIEGVGALEVTVVDFHI